jgi:hypothetical protein
MVSRKPDAICLHCGTVLDKCEINYGEFMNMTEENRNEFKENYKKRLMLYAEKMINSENKKSERTFI